MPKAEYAVFVTVRRLSAPHLFTLASSGYSFDCISSSPEASSLLFSLLRLQETKVSISLLIPSSPLQGLTQACLQSRYALSDPVSTPDHSPETDTDVLKIVGAHGFIAIVSVQALVASLRRLLAWIVKLALGFPSVACRLAPVLCSGSLECCRLTSHTFGTFAWLRRSKDSAASLLRVLTTWLGGFVQW